MKVICITDKQLFGPPQVNNWLIKEGEIYEVAQEISNQWGLYYELTMQLGVGYPCENFIPLSEIDETTFERNYNKETA